MGAERFGFECVAETWLEDDFAGPRGEIAAYISTQSKGIADVKRDEERLERVLEPIERGAKSSWGEARGAFSFRGALRVLRLVRLER